MNGHLIAHRGEPVSFPENSIEGYRVVLEAGARYLETDVQISADQVAVLSHDPSLLKITGQDRVVTKTNWQNMCDLPAGYPERFGDRFANLRLNTLAEFVELLLDWPDALAFVEIKHASIKAFGAAAVIDLMLHALAPARAQCILISFEYEALQLARAVSDLPIGWVLPEWSDTMQQQADSLAPDYLFVNHKRLPDDATLWQGPWQWATYTLNDVDGVSHYRNRGFDLVETNEIRKLIQEQGTDVDTL